MPRSPFLQLSSIWQQRSFRNLWLGTTVSAFGSEISGVAIPLTAVLLLGATSAQMGVLRAVGTFPALLFGFVAGVWIDRLRRRPILIVADIGRALLLAVLPLAAIFGSLHLPLLYLIAFTVGTLTIFFDIAYLSFVPSLVSGDDLLEANIKVNFSLSLAGVLGPGIAGMLVQLIAAPFVVALDALSFLMSALFIRGIVCDEPPAPMRSQRNLLAEIGEGLRQVYSRSVNMILATVGALVGGLLGEIIGLEATLAAGALGLASAALVVFGSPLRRVQEIQGV